VAARRVVAEAVQRPERGPVALVSGWSRQMPHQLIPNRASQAIRGRIANACAA